MSKVTLKYLAQLLERAVPNVKVKSAVLVRSSVGLYWIQVDPRHYDYWRRFREAHPHWVQVARTYKATDKSLMVEGFCPEFGSSKNLMSWLFDVLKLTQGERSLLLLLHEREVRCHSI
ncbi:hypothetical protein DRO59_00970 [Candidatus Bathyarchaeota archaeon]|nr:MAG: hypothetical protein DRO59_00970 [Candidatus Bathyarchaeota archaeon]